MRKYSDQELIQLLASANNKDNDQALRYMYIHYFDLIQELVLKNSGTAENVADIFQDGLIAIYNKAKDPQFKLTSSLATYLYTICRNLWFKQIRAEKREVKLEDTALQIADDQELNLQALIRTERGELIADLMEQMGEDCKNILLYFYYEQLRMKEIVKRMNLSGEAVAKNKKANCMKRLRKKVMESPLYKSILK